MITKTARTRMQKPREVGMNKTRITMIINNNREAQEKQTQDEVGKGPTKIQRQQQP